MRSLQSFRRVFIVSKHHYSDYTLVAVKTTREAAEKMLGLCWNCKGTGKELYDDTEACFCCDGVGRLGPDDLNAVNDVREALLEWE